MATGAAIALGAAVAADGSGAAKLETGDGVATAVGPDGSGVAKLEMAEGAATAPAVALTGSGVAALEIAVGVAAPGTVDAVAMAVALFGTGEGTALETAVGSAAAPEDPEAIAMPPPTPVRAPTPTTTATRLRLFIIVCLFLHHRGPDRTGGEYVRRRRSGCTRNSRLPHATFGAENPYGMGVRVSKREREFREYAMARESQLRRSAYLLSGDWHEAQDLTQTTLMKLYVAWGSVRADGNVDAYARQILARTFIDQQRRGRWREKPYEELPNREAAQQFAAAQESDLRLTLQDALARLSPGFRAVLVLRYWEDLSVEQTASALGVTVGTVKSQSARALVRLRQLVGEDLVDVNEW